MKEGKGNPKERTLEREGSQTGENPRNNSLNGKGTEEWRELKSEEAFGKGRNLEKKGPQE